MRAFITGSRCYGTPRPDSDLDLVVLVDEDTLEQLESMAEELEPSVPGVEYATLRFGLLNVIALLDEGDFNTWRDVTRQLYERRPVTREQAVAALKAAGI